MPVGTGTSPPPSERFGRGHRLTSRQDFLTVQDEGRRVPGSHYLLLARPRAGHGGAQARLGITVSKKVGKAVQRNLVKRWVRESYRRMSDLAPRDTDLVVIARPSAAAGSFMQTHTELRALLRRLARPSAAR